MSETFITKSAEETTKLGEKIGKSLKGGDLLLLTGDLGGGKTQFTKGVARALGISEMVVSPTFTIERAYQGKRLTLHHFDLYRTHEDRELFEEISEFTRSSNDITVVEWPENMKSLSEFPHTLISFEYLEDNERKLTLEKVGDEWS